MYTAYFAYFAYFETFLSQDGLMSVSSPSCTGAVNNYKYCMSFQYPPYLDAYHLFHWERPGPYPLKCGKNPISQELPVINPISVAMDVGGGTSSAGPSHGEASHSGNKLGDTMSQGCFLNI